MTSDVRAAFSEQLRTQPVICSAFAGRQALIDAAARAGFSDLAAELHASEPAPMARVRATSTSTRTRRRALVS